MHNAEFVNALKEALNGLRTVHMVGEEWVSYVGDIPAGGVPYCGQEVNRSTYSALWEYANAKGLVKSESEWQSLYNAQGGNVAYYSSGNGSSTFRMPRLVGYVRGASSQSESGKYVAEGLPNITASTDIGKHGSGIGISLQNTAGAFGTLRTATSDAYGAGATANLQQGLSFDASRSNAIYGSSSHVTPETSVVLYGVYAFGEIGNVDALDVTTLASAVARVESNLDSKLNADTIRVVETWSSGATWYRKYSDGWVEQGGVAKGSSTLRTVTLNIAFSNTSYYCNAIRNNTSSPSWTSGGATLALSGKTTTTFNVGSTNDMGDVVEVYWFACGY